MSAQPHDLEALKRQVAVLERGAGAGVHARFSLGFSDMDQALGGGLPQGALHEVFGPRTSDAPATTGFAIALSLRAAQGKPIVWVRQDFAGVETGQLYAPGLAELGLSPDRLILVRARDAPGVLRAAEEAARCGPLGAVLIEPWGSPKTLDLTASRRLALAAGQSGLALVMMRPGAEQAASAAASRWQVSSAPSQPLEADAPGHPAFNVELLRQRAGAPGRRWRVEWNRDAQEFRQQFGQFGSGGRTPLSGGMVSLPADRSPAAAVGAA